MRAVVTSVALMVCASASAQQPIPVDTESHHKIVFSDQVLRVLEVVVPEGDETLDHAHRYDIVTVCIECAATRTRQPGEPWGEIHPRKTGGFLIAEYAGKPAAHAVRNVGKGFYRLVGIESLRESGWPVGKPIGSVSGATIGEESRAFRVYDVHLGPGNAAAQHVHTAPTVVVLDTGDVTNAMGSASRRLAKPGEWIVLPAGTAHTLSAQGSKAAHLVEFEVR